MLNAIGKYWRELRATVTVFPIWCFPAFWNFSWFNSSEANFWVVMYVLLPFVAIVLGVTIKISFHVKVGKRSVWGPLFGIALLGMCRLDLDLGRPSDIHWTAASIAVLLGLLVGAGDSYHWEEDREDRLFVSVLMRKLGGCTSLRNGKAFKTGELREFLLRQILFFVAGIVTAASIGYAMYRSHLVDWASGIQIALALGVFLFALFFAVVSLLAVGRNIRITGIDASPEDREDITTDIQSRKRCE